MKKPYLHLCLLLCVFCVGKVKAQCPDTTQLGMASNIFTHILNESNNVIFNNDLNTVIFIHRHNTGQFGGHSGNLRYDISTNGGASWNTNQGVLNPASVNGTNAARYPQVSIYNPPNNTVVDSAYLVYQAATVNTTWNGICTGVRQLDGTGNTENYNQATSTMTLIPRAQVEGKQGEFWAIDAVWNGTAVSAYRVLKGVWNNTTKDVVWSINATLTPPFNTVSGAVSASDFCIAFDPSGDIGWVCLLTHITPGPASQSFYPVFYHTTNGGTSWSGPEQVDINEFSCITSNILATNVPTTAFDLDLEVDMHGIPHALVGMGNGSNAYGIFYTQWHAMFDITRNNGIWNAIQLDTLNAGRGNFGVAPNTTTLDQFSQSSRTEDGSKLFFTFTDSRSGLIGGENIVPDLYGIAYDANTRTWTTRRNMTACNPITNGEIFYPHVSPIAKSGAGVWTLPLVYAQFNNSGLAIDPTSFIYADSLQFTSADFFIPLCNIPLTISASDTVQACGSVLLDGGANHDAYEWSTGDTSRFLTVTTSGFYTVGIRDICCTGADSVYVIIDPTTTANFGFTTNGLGATFTDSSTASPSTWSWDFGDGNMSTQQNPMHTYATAGTYTVCLISTNPCGPDTTCQTVTITCAGPVAGFSAAANELAVAFTDTSNGIPSSWSWDFGDGNVSSMQSPGHTYAVPGTYTVCLIVDNPCGVDSICDTITVTCPAPVASFTVNITPGDSVATFTNNSTASGNQYLWDFGDGDSDTATNPIHFYGTAGIYSACLTVTNICGTDTVCDTINISLTNRMAWNGPEQLEVFPVPTTSGITVRGTLDQSTEMQFTLLDLQGRVVQELGRQQLGGPFELTFDLSQLAVGAYFLRLSNTDGSTYRKVLRE